MGCLGELSGDGAGGGASARTSSYRRYILGEFWPSQHTPPVLHGVFLGSRSHWLNLTSHLGNRHGTAQAPRSFRAGPGPGLPHGSRETCDSRHQPSDLKGKEAEERR